MPSTFGSAKLDADILSPAPVEGPGEFSKGLRSGALGMESQLKSLAGGIGGALGYQDFAAERNAAAQRTAQEAQAAAPRVGSYRDVTSLRDALDYGAGLAGQAVPSVGLGVAAGGLVAATGGGALPALAAGAASQLPFETGDVLQRQQLDPTARLRGAGENLRDAVLTGGASAIGQAIVPAALGGKLVGKAVQGVERGALKEGVKAGATGIGKSALRDAGIEGASEGAGELVKQQGVGFGNAPDWQAAGDAAVGGALVGGGLGAIGGAADAAHANKNAAIDAVKGVAERGTAAIKNAAQKTQGAPADLAGAASDAVGDKDFTGLADNVGAMSKQAINTVMQKGREGLDRLKKAGQPVDRTLDEAEVDSPLAGLSQPERDEVAEPTTARERVNALLNTGAEKAGQAIQSAATALAGAVDVPPAVRQRAAEVAQGASDAASKAWVATETKAREVQQSVSKKLDSVISGVQDRVAERRANKAEDKAGVADLNDQLQRVSDEVEAEAAAQGWDDSRKMQEMVTRSSGILDAAMEDQAQVDTKRGERKRVKKSEDFSGVRDAVMQDLLPLAAKNKMNLVNTAKFVKATQEFIKTAADPGGNFLKVEKAANALRSVFPEADHDALDSALVSVYTKIGSENPRDLRQFMANVNGSKKGMSADRALRSTVASALADKGDINVDDYTDALLSWARGETDVTDLEGVAVNRLNRAEVGEAKTALAEANEMANASFRAQLQEDLGPKFQPVMDAVAKHLENEQVRGATGFEVESMDSDEQLTDANGVVEKDGDPRLEPAEDSVQYFANKYADKAKLKPIPMQNPATQNKLAPDGKTGSTQKKLDTIKGQYPGAQVEWVSMKEAGLGESTTHGVIRVTKAPEEGTINDNDWGAARLDTQKTGKDTKTESLIEMPMGDKDPAVFGLDEKSGGVLRLDAVKVARIGMDALNKTVGSDGQSDSVRLARGFMEAVAQLTDQFGVAPTIKGSTVIGHIGGEKFTAAMAKKIDVRTNEDKKTDNARKATEERIATMREAYKKETDADQKANIRKAASDMLRAQEDAKSKAMLAGDNSEQRALTLADELLSGDGKYEVDSAGNIHELELTKGKGVNSVNDLEMNRTGLDERDDGLAVQGERSELRAKPARFSASAREAVMKLMESDSPIAERLAKRVGALMSNSTVLGTKERTDLDRALSLSDRTVGSVAAVANPLFEKYKAILQTPKLQSDGNVLTPEAKERQKAKDGDQKPISRIARDPNWKPGDFSGDLDGYMAQLRAEGKTSDAEGYELDADGRRVGGPPRPKARAAQVAALDQAASSSDPALLAELNSTDNISGLQRTAEYLAKNHPDTEAARVAAENFDRAIQDPNTAYSLQRANGQTVGPIDRRPVLEYLKKTLGNSVAVEWSKIPHAGEFDSDIMGDVIRISVHALNPKSVAYHESLHAFFKQLRGAGEGRIAQVLEKAASQKHVIDQMNAFFKNEPAVLKQIKTDREEAAAYMYQLWAQGDLKLNPQATTIFQKVTKFIRDVLGIWSNDQRALHIMEHFNSGEYAKNIGRPNATALLTPGTNKAVEMAKQLFKPATDLGSTVFAAGGARLRDTGNAALIELADAIKPLGTEGKDPGFLVASRNERAVRMNALANDLTDATQADLSAALKVLQEGGASGNTQVQSIVETVKKHLQDAKKYLDAAKVQMGDLGPDYFPRVWDPSIISGKQAEFLAMMDKYVQLGLYKGDPQLLLNQLIANDGNDFAVDTRVPGFQSGKTRELDFITGDDAQPFLSPDLYKTMNSYVSQTTRRAEFARRFGEDGRGLDALLSQAKAKGATEQQLKTAEQYIKGVTGTLGDDISPTARRLMGNVLVYQNLRLLPLAIFSSIVDPLGIAVRGGTVGEAWGAFKRGVREVPKGFKGEGTKDWQTELAETLGVIDNASLLNAVGALHTQGMVGDTARKINDSLFKFNLMEQYNRSMRVAATETALKFIQRHATTDPQSVRWLDELGLTARDVRNDPATGRLRVTVDDGLTEAQATKMRNAVNKWVDGAVLRPDAADRPIWFNDPRFMLISHLKSFVYAFHHTIIDRVVHEAQQGNYKPLAVMGSYVPIMIGADYMKGFIQGGGEQPAWKKDWGPTDYIWSGVQRGGLLGVGQFGVDVVNDIQRGGAGLGAVTGPSLDQLIDGVQVAGGTARFETFALDAMPANALYGAVVR